MDSYSSAFQTTRLLLNLQKELKDPMTDFDFENMGRCLEMYPIEANWKLSIENYQECYHCATAHPEYAKMHNIMLDRKQEKECKIICMKI